MSVVHNRQSVTARSNAWWFLLAFQGRIGRGAFWLGVVFVFLLTEFVRTMVETSRLLAPDGELASLPLAALVALCLGLGAPV